MARTSWEQIQDNQRITPGARLSWKKVRAVSPRCACSVEKKLICENLCSSVLTKFKNTAGQVQTAITSAETR
jgi:hypothetical protein